MNPLPGRRGDSEGGASGRSIDMGELDAEVRATQREQAEALRGQFVEVLDREVARGSQSDGERIRDREGKTPEQHVAGVAAEIALLLYENPQGSKRWALSSLAGVEGEEAQEIRRRAIGDYKRQATSAEYEDGGLLDDVASSLTAIDSDEAWEMRDELLEMGVDIRTIVSSTGGLHSERAERSRRSFLRDREAQPEFGDLDLRNLDRKDLEALGQSLIGLNTKQAWEMRDAMIELAHPDGLERSLMGVDGERADDMRSRLWEERRYLSESLYGVGGEAATNLRRVAKKSSEQKLRDQGGSEEIRRRRFYDDVEALLLQAGSDRPEVWKERRELLDSSGFADPKEASLWAAMSLMGGPKVAAIVHERNERYAA